MTWVTNLKFPCCLWLPEQLSKVRDKIFNGAGDHRPAYDSDEAGYDLDFTQPGDGNTSKNN